MILIILIPILIISFYFFVINSSRSVDIKIKQGFPENWEKILKGKVGFYHTLSPEIKNRFKERVQRFVLSKPIYGFKTSIDDEIKLLVASSAVMITLSFKNWNFSYLTSVIVSDEPLNIFQGEGSFVLGQVQTIGNKSKMFLSKSSLIQGFKNLKDKKNVAVHEFAHVLDHADGEIDGIPKGIMPPELIEGWVELMDHKTEEIKNNDSNINDYAATNKAEFFAVNTEYFFEKPNDMKRRHPKLYKFLSEIFRQDNSSKFKVNFKELMGRVSEKIGRNSRCPCGSGKKFKKCCLKL